MKDLKEILVTEKKNDYGYDQNKLDKQINKLIEIIKTDLAPNYPEMHSFYDVMDAFYNEFDDDFFAMLKEYFKTIGKSIIIRNNK